MQNTFLIHQGEVNSSLRTIFFQLLDSTTLTGRSGLTAPSGRIHIVKANSSSAIAHTGTFTEISPVGRGIYSYVFDLTEIDTPGPLCFSYSGGSTRTDMMLGQVLPSNIYSSSGIPTNVQYWAGGLVTTPRIEGIPLVDVSYVQGSGVFSTGIIDANVTHWDSIRVATPDVTGLPKVTISGTISASVPNPVNANVVQWVGHNVVTPYTTGVPLVNIVHGTGIGQLNVQASGSNSMASAVWDAPLLNHTTFGTFGGSNQPSYQIYIVFNEDDTNGVDEYTLTWFKNGQPYNPSSDVTIQVVNSEDGNDIVAETTMSQTPGYYHYYFSTTSRLGVGQAAIAIITATLDGDSRTFNWIVSRDDQQ